MAPSVEKKIAELEMGLLHLQQNIDIPDISLPIHPTVAQVLPCSFSLPCSHGLICEVYFQTYYYNITRVIAHESD